MMLQDIPLVSSDPDDSNPEDHEEPEPAGGGHGLSELPAQDQGHGGEGQLSL